MMLYSNRLFGIEIEVSMISPSDAAEALYAAGISCVVEDYNHKTRNYWKAVTDASIRSSNGLSCEVVSPPMPCTEESLKTVARVLQALLEAGAIVNDSCGIHVHVDCRRITDVDFFRIVHTVYSRYENEFDLAFYKNRRLDENRFCQSTNSNVFNLLYNSNTIVADLKGLDRYRKLNLASVFRHGTVEFRQHEGSLDAKKVTKWISLCVNIIDTANAIYNKKNLILTLEQPTIQDESDFIMYVNALQGLINFLSSTAIKDNEFFCTATKKALKLDSAMESYNFMVEFVNKFSQIHKFSRKNKNRKFAFWLFYAAAIFGNNNLFNDFNNFVKDDNFMFYAVMAGIFFGKSINDINELKQFALTKIKNIVNSKCPLVQQLFIEIQKVLTKSLSSKIMELNTISMKRATTNLFAAITPATDNLSKIHSYFVKFKLASEIFENNERNRFRPATILAMQFLWTIILNLNVAQTKEFNINSFNDLRLALKPNHMMMTGNLNKITPQNYFKMAEIVFNTVEPELKELQATCNS